MADFILKGKADFREIDKRMKTLPKDSQKAAKKVSAGWKSAGKAIATGLGVATVAAGLAGKAFVDLQQQIADARNELIDASTRSGIAAETLNGLKLAAKGSGQQFANLEGALNRFPKVLGDTAKGVGEAIDAFEVLGVATKDSSGDLRDADDVFKDVLDSLGKVESTTEKAALSTEIFGRSGGRMVQAFGGATDTLDTFAELANKFGTQVGPEAAKAANNWQREMANLDLVVGGAKETLFDFGTTGAEALRTVQIGVVTMTTLVDETFAVMTETVKSFGTFWVALLSGDVRKAQEAFAKGNIVTIVRSLDAAIDKAGEAGQEYADLAEKLSRTSGNQRVAANTAISYSSALDKTADSAKKATDALVELDTAGLGDFGDFADALKDLESVREDLRAASAADEDLLGIQIEIERIQELKRELEGIEEAETVLTERLRQLWTELNDELEAQDAALRTQRLESLQLVGESALNFGDALAGSVQQLNQLEINRAQDRIDQITQEAGGIDELTEADKARIAVQNSIIQSQFETQKAAARIQAIINTAEAVTKALTLGAAAPFAIAAIGVTSATQQAIISAQQPPPPITFDRGGVVASSFSRAAAPGAGGTVGTPDRTSITARNGEVVFTPEQARAMGGAATNIVVQNVYEHRTFGAFVRNDERRGGSLSRATRSRTARTGHRVRTT